MHCKSVWLYLVMLLMFGAPIAADAAHLGAEVGHPTPGNRLPEDVRNTLHNLGDSTTGFDNPNIVAAVGSNRDACVFCHTPHGASSTAPGAAPLWNRQIPVGPYALYTSPNMDSTTVAPVGVSLACLSCHDGALAVDALINMPGSGGFRGFTPTSADLVNPQGTTALIDVGGSMTETTRTDTGANYQAIAGGASPFPNLTTTLSDDHPISMAMGTVDPQFTNTQVSDSGNVTLIGRNAVVPTTYYADKRDAIRLYGASGSSTNAGNKTDWVECASCHNPHAPRPLFLRLPAPLGGVAAMPSGGGAVTVGDVLGVTDTQRIADNPNAGSAICLSCHEK